MSRSSLRQYSPGNWAHSLATASRMSANSSGGSVAVIGTRLADRGCASWRCGMPTGFWRARRKEHLCPPCEFHDLARRVGKAQACPPSCGYAHRQGLDAPDKTRIDPLRFADHLDALKTLQHLLPDDFQLQFG